VFRDGGGRQAGGGPGLRLLIRLKFLEKLLTEKMANSYSVVTLTGQAYIRLHNGILNFTSGSLLSEILNTVDVCPLSSMSLQQQQQQQA